MTTPLDIPALLARAKEWLSTISTDRRHVLTVELVANLAAALDDIQSELQTVNGYAEVLSALAKIRGDERDAALEDAKRYRFLLSELDRVDPTISAICKVEFDRSSYEWANFANGASLTHAIDALLTKGDKA